MPAAPVPPAAGNGGGRLLSPLVRRLVAEHGLDVSAIPGTGAGGRIRREDVEKAVAARGARPAAPAAAAAPAPAAAPAAPAAARAVKAPADGRDKVEPLTRMRLAVADTVKASQTLAASVWTSVEVDFDNVDQVRAKFKAQFKKETGASLTYLPFISRAVFDRAARIPDGELLDRPRSQDDDAAPVRQPRHRRRSGRAGPGRAGRQGTRTR